MLNSYAKLNEYLGNCHSKLVKKSRAQTIAIRNVNHLIPEKDWSISIKLYNTKIITFRPDGTIQLRNGGWQTQTTKKRINDHLPNGWRLFQENFTWILTHFDDDNIPDDSRLFEDGMEIPMDKRCQ